MLFESVAYAMAAPPEGAEGGDGMLMQFLPLILMIGIFYLLLIRPQQKKAKEHRNLLQNLRKNDVVWTNGGIKGRITDIDGDELTVEIADKVEIVVNRSYVAGLAGAQARKDDQK